MSSVRGRGDLKLFDRYVGIPAVALMGVRRKRTLPRDVRRIGLMKTAAIGDTALLAGLVDDVKATFPSARLTLISGFDNAGVIPLLGPAVDDTVTVSPRQVVASIRGLRSFAFDVLVDFGAWPRFDALLAAMSGARFTVGFETAGQFRHYAYDATVAHSPTAHERENYASLLGAIGVAATTPPRILPPGRLGMDRIPSGPFAVFHPWSSGYRHEVKEWALDRWVSLAAMISTRAPEVVITGGRNEVERSRELADRMRGAGIRVTDMTGGLSLSELTDLLAASEVVVSVNTGVAHLAGLVDARTVSLEGPTPPARWAPIGPRTRPVVTTLAGSGYLNLGFEYGGRRLDCMDGISVEAVAEAVLEITSTDEMRRSAPKADAARHLAAPSGGTEGLSIFKKCGAYTTAHETEALGRYPYYWPIEESTTTEARIEGEWKVMVGSNNYLGLTHHPKVLEAARNALTKYGSGSTGSRLLNGTLDLHYELEARLARFFNKESALVFTTGYQASVGVIAQLVGRGEHVFLDKLDHASLVDGARLSNGEMHRYPHGDFASLDKQLTRIPSDANKLIVSDGVFSMEGTIVDLPGLVSVARKHGAQTMIDEAHALGVLGPDGAGTASHFGMLDDVDLILATFSKSLASVGGVVAGPADVIHWLRHFSRALIFTAAMPPSSVAGALAALEIMRSEPERRERLWANTNAVADGLRAMGFDIGASQTPVIPVLIGNFDNVLRAWRSLFDDGVFSHPIVPPAVSMSACRIRVSMSAEHTPQQIDRVLGAFERVAKMLGSEPAVF